jgi:hypothetical protein
MNKFFTANAQLKREVDRLLYGAPFGSGGEVEVKRFRGPDGRFSYDVNQRSNSGGWASPDTYDLAVANLAAEALALAGAKLLQCKECDAEQEQ